MMTPQTYYDVLNVSASADDKAIRRAYLKASLQHHPDKNMDDVEGAKARFIDIGHAYEVLSDPEKRATYDRELARGTWRRRKVEGTDEYESYQNKFDAFFAGLSDDELRTAQGVASVVGGIIGSVIGSRISKNVPGGGMIVSTAGSLMGSIVGSRAGSNIVQSIHDRSLERLSDEERRREAVERGEEPPEPRANKAWEDLKKNVNKTVENITNAASKSPSGPDSQQQQGRTPGAGFNIAGAFANLAKNASGKGNPNDK